MKNWNLAFAISLFAVSFATLVGCSTEVVEEPQPAPTTQTPAADEEEHVDQVKQELRARGDGCDLLCPDGSKVCPGTKCP